MNTFTTETDYATGITTEVEWRREYLASSDRVLVDRHQTGELNPAETGNWCDMPLRDVDWSTSRGTMVVQVGFNPDHDAVTPTYTVERDKKGRAYYEVRV